VRCWTKQDLPDGARLLRRVQDHADWLEWSSDHQRFLPRIRPKNSIRFDPELSTSWREHLWQAHQVGPEAVLAGDPRYSLVFQLTARQARDITLTAEHDPDCTQPEPLGCAHCSIGRPPGVEKKIISSKIAETVTYLYSGLRGAVKPGLWDCDPG